MRPQPTFLLALLTTLVLVAAACGSATTATTGTTPTSDQGETVELVDEPTASGGGIGLSTPISEQDLDAARLVLDTARVRWDEQAASAYTMRFGVESINQFEIDFDSDGSVLDERVVSGNPDDDSWGDLPRSVQAAFNLVEASLERFESGELEVPRADDCGNHFNAQFDPDLGAPTYFDTLGPCDDGVGFRFAIIAIS